MGQFSMTISAVAGSVLSDNQHVTVSNRSEAQLADSAAQGFQIAVRGEGAVMEALGNIRAMATSRAGQAKFRAMYGNLYEWVRSTGGDIDPGPIRDLLREHILQTTAVGQGDMVLGHEITQRRMHSAYSLAIAMRLHPKRLRKILVRLGIASENCDDLDYNRLVFPVGDTERICLDLISAVPLSGLPREIGCTRSQAEGLCHGGVINPIAASGGGIGRIDFARTEIASFLEWISGLPEIAPADNVDMTRAAKMTSLSTAELIRHAKEGDLLIGRLPGEPRVSALLIPMLAIREIQIKTRGPPVMV